MNYYVSQKSNGEFVPESALRHHHIKLFAYYFQSPFSLFTVTEFGNIWGTK